MKYWIDNSSAELRRLYLRLEEEIKKTKEQEHKEKASRRDGKLNEDFIRTICLCALDVIPWLVAFTNRG